MILDVKRFLCLALYIALTTSNINYGQLGVSGFVPNLVHRVDFSPYNICLISVFRIVENCDQGITGIFNFCLQALNRLCPDNFLTST